MISTFYATLSAMKNAFINASLKYKTFSKTIDQDLLEHFACELKTNFIFYKKIKLMNIIFQNDAFRPSNYVQSTRSKMRLHHPVRKTARPNRHTPNSPAHRSMVNSWPSTGRHHIRGGNALKSPAVNHYSHTQILYLGVNHHDPDADVR